MQALIPNVRSQSYPFEAAHRPQQKQKQKGYTIVELSIAVAIAGVLLVSAVGLVQTVLQTSRANETATWLTRAVSQIDKIWKDQNGYVGLDLASANAAGALKGVTVDTTVTPIRVTSKFNRSIYLGLTPNLPTLGANAGYVLTLAGVPTAVCADLVTSAAAGGFRSIVITPEATAAATLAGITDVNLSAAGVLTRTTAGSSTAFDPSSPSVQLGNMTGTNGCGTANGTVALSFYAWK